jgi:hypothetical protein
MHHTRTLIAGLAVLALTAGCGGSSGSSSASSAPSASATSAPAASGTTSTGASSTEAPPSSTGSTSADASPAHTVADNEIFPLVKSAAGDYAIRLPGWWRLKQDGSDTRSAKLDSFVVVRVRTTKKPATLEAVQKSMAKQQAKGAITIEREAWKPKHQLTLEPAFKSIYTTEVPKSTTTGKPLTLMVIRYDFVKGTKRAMVLLAAPKGVDNVAPYHVIGRSFRWTS